MIAINLLGRVIVPLLLPRTPSGSEEGPPMTTRTVLPNAALVRKAAKIAAVGLPTRRKTTNVHETQIGGVEIVRRMLATDVRHHRKSLRRSACRTSLPRYRRRPLYRRRHPPPHGRWPAVANRRAMESRNREHASVLSAIANGNVVVNASGSGSANGYHARAHSNINIIESVIVNVIANLLLCTTRGISYHRGVVAPTLR